MTDDRRPPFLLRAMKELEPMLRELGYALAIEHYDHSGAGSAFALYARKGGRMRLVWDGKLSAVWAETAPSQLESWRDVEPRQPGAVDRAQDDDRLQRLKLAV